MDGLLRDEAWSRNAVHQPNSNHVLDLLETTPTALAKTHGCGASTHASIISLPLCTVLYGGTVPVHYLYHSAACVACNTCAAATTPSP